MTTLMRLLRTILTYVVLTACATTPTPASLPAPTTAHSPAQPPATAPQAAIGPGILSLSLHMLTGRATHTATLLPDGRVLIAGGFRPQGSAEVPIRSAEIYDPESNTFTPTGDMTEARAGHTATLLPNGQVLIVGGWGIDGRLSTAELYDPSSGTFSYAASLAGPRASMTATLLQRGQVLIAGGDHARNTFQLVAELYDPVANAFAPTGSLNYGRTAHTATPLSDGTVLLVGGRGSPASVLASAELYDPLTATFRLTGDLNTARNKHAAVRLHDGKVLVVGGSNHNDWTGKYASAEIYHADTGAFKPTADLNAERFKLAEAAILMNNGSVLVAGGNSLVEVFDPFRQQFLAGQSLGEAYYYTALTLLADGRVLITGGYDDAIRPTDQAWIFSSS